MTPCLKKENWETYFQNFIPRLKNQKYLGQKRLLRSLSPTANLRLPSPPLALAHPSVMLLSSLTQLLEQTARSGKMEEVPYIPIKSDSTALNTWKLTGCCKQWEYSSILQDAELWLIACLLSNSSYFLLLRGSSSTCTSTPKMSKPLLAVARKSF